MFENYRTRATSFFRHFFFSCWMSALGTTGSSLLNGGRATAPWPLPPRTSYGNVKECLSAWLVTCFCVKKITNLLSQSQHLYVCLSSRASWYSSLWICHNIGPYCLCLCCSTSFSFWWSFYSAERYQNFTRIFCILWFIECIVVVLYSAGSY